MKKKKGIRRQLSENSNLKTAVCCLKTEIKPKNAEQYSRIPAIVRTDFDEPKKKSAVVRKQKASKKKVKKGIGK